MKTEIYAIKDTKVAFQLPFYQPNRAAAIRAFRNGVNTKGSELNLNASDVELWQLGVYDDETGAIVSKPDFVCTGVSLKNEI